MSDTDVADQCSALAEELVLGERLAIVVPPGCDIGVCVHLNVSVTEIYDQMSRRLIYIRCDIRVDVIRCREVVGVASVVDIVRVLINSDVVDLQGCGE